MDEVADMKGTRQVADALQGRGLLQSADEWEARNATLVQSISGLIRTYQPPRSENALDVGSAEGGLTDRLTQVTALRWCAIDPDIKEKAVLPCGVELIPAYGHCMPFADLSFDVVTFINVFEHVSPEWRADTISEFKRVLKPGGILVGQLPNPYFPIESHSRLPFFGWVPRPLQPLYWRVSPTGWDFETAHFFIVTIRDLRRIAEKIGFEIVIIRNFNYPVDAIPKAVRSLAVLHSWLGIVPWSWQFVFKKR